MKNLNTQKGFTLVELAIVMTIIGLLIGGILKGQELMQNARVTATIAQVRAYEAAVTTFRDKYDAIPGDMGNASARIPGCLASVNCNPVAATANDSIVGAANWAAAWANQSIINNPPTVVATETELFWTHLLAADLISGVTNTALTATTVGWRTSNPDAKVGGGFIVGNSDGTARLPGAPAAAALFPSGMSLAIMLQPTTVLNTSTTTGAQPLTPGRAAQIDRKMDDGNPNGGYVQSYGLVTSCYAGAAAPYTYLENLNALDCGLVMRIQG